MSELTHKDLLWFRLANANPPQGFYAFKDRFLKRFATPAGWDKQEIDHACWTCEGSGFYSPGNPCRKCDGSGVYDTSKNWLQRWDLSGHIYHKPFTFGEMWVLNEHQQPTPVDFIEGRIRHDYVDPNVARRAFYRLLIRHEPVTFYNVITERIKSRASFIRAKLVWKLIRLRNKLDLFKAVPEDDLPF